MEPTLVILAAGMSRRYGKPKATVPIGPRGETLIDYAIFDARRAGFGNVVVVTRSGIQPALGALITERWPDASIRFAFQDAPTTTTADRAHSPSQPHGTGHAVLAAGELVDGPFASINCDDFYGVQAYRVARDHLSAHSEDHALVGYRLGATLSPTGGVSRALCDTAPSGLLRNLTEVLDVRRADGSIGGVTPNGERLTLNENDIISMNFWVFQPTIFGALEKLYVDFLGSMAQRDDEFRLSNAIGMLASHGDIRVKVLASDGPWFGITRPEDQTHAQSTIRSMIAEGLYPSDIATPSARQ